ncbi:MAG: methyltransferase [Candidatus Cloacimonetes bacterium]|nr:methyltransferase [Candidatus Cloacimonadota bacterium]MDD2505747.1 methyltransferase [Candidatus Cloacimonadota bacterium]MDD4559169.1 methyltransferase [Candidatus Cloacimonadota bacterium]
MATYQEVLLPFAGKKIKQDSSGQGVSIAAELLYREVIATGGHGALRAVELGCGCGIVSIMCALSRPLWKISAIEIQTHLAALAWQNAAACGVELELHCGNMKELTGQYDLVFTNPPWRKLNSGHLSPNSERNICRFELEINMEELLASIQRLMAPQGKAILIYPAQRWEDLQQLIGNTLLDIIKHTIHYGNKAFLLAIIKHRDVI